MHDRARHAPRIALVIGAALLELVTAGCGGSGSDPGALLFAGTASELLPHESGRSVMFQVRETTETKSATSRFTSTVLRNEPDGTFVVEYVSANRDRLTTRSRDTGDEIRIEEILAMSLGGAEVEHEQPAEAPRGDPPLLIDPPAVIVRTPVIAGEAIETRFARDFEITIEVEGETVVRRALFRGSSRRVPVELDTVTVPTGTFHGAIRYSISANGSAEVDVGGRSLEVTVAVDGDEWFVPGLGAVKESVDARFGAAHDTATVHLTSERVDDADAASRRPSRSPNP